MTYDSILARTPPSTAAGHTAIAAEFVVFLTTQIEGDRAAFDQFSLVEQAHLRALLLTWRGHAIAASLIANGLSDTSQAEYFAALYGADWRYDHSNGVWRTFDAPLWRAEYPGEVNRLLIQCARDQHARARLLQDPNAQKKALQFYKYCQMDIGLSKVRKVAQSLHPIAVDGGIWDRDPWVAGSPSGVIDLRTGALADDPRAYHVTKSLGAPFDPTATCPRWLQFLREVFEDSLGLIRYIARLAGYLLTGDTTAQLWWMFHGSGANGKSVLLNILAYVLGDYGKTVPFSTFQLLHQRSEITDDLASLPGLRFIYASETLEDKALDEARMKMLTGGDRISARPLYGRSFQYTPSHKIVLSCNHKPPIRDDSPGFWRRVHFVPFKRSFEGADRDDRLEETLKAEAPGILAWMVEGCLDWQCEGLEPPHAIREASLEYREDSDHITEFLETCCENDAQATCAASDLFRRYQSWVGSQRLPSDRILSAQSFGERMAKQFTRKRTERGNVYIGMRLRGMAQAA